MAFNKHQCYLDFVKLGETLKTETIVENMESMEKVKDFFEGIWENGHTEGLKQGLKHNSKLK